MIWVGYFGVKYSCNNNVLQKTNILGDILMSSVHYCDDILEWGSCLTMK